MVFNRSRRLFNPLLLAPEGLTLYESSKDNRFKEMQEGRTGEGRGWSGGGARISRMLFDLDCSRDYLCDSV